jgi:hypothetical protein
MKYLCMLYIAEENLPVPGTPEHDKLVTENVALNTAMSEAGVLVESGPLYPVSSATTLRVRDGETLLTDGPYAELKEQIGGYYMIDCASLDDALRWARMIPAASFGAVEVRPVREVHRG